MDVFSRQLFCIIYLWAFSASFVGTNFCRSHYWKKRFLGKIKYLSSNFNYLLREKMEYISHESYFFHFPFPLRSCCYCCFYLFQQSKKYQSSLNLLKREQRALYFFQNRNLSGFRWGNGSRKRSFYDNILYVTSSKFFRTTYCYWLSLNTSHVIEK